MERSHSQVMTGRVAAIFRSMYRLGKSSGSHAFSDEAHESAMIRPLNLNFPPLEFEGKELWRGYFLWLFWADAVLPQK